MGKRRIIREREPDEYYDPYRNLEGDLRAGGMTIQKARFINRFCRAL